MRPKLTTDWLPPIPAPTLGSVLVVACYFFVDRPVAWFVHDHRLYPGTWLTLAPWLSEWTIRCIVVAIAAVVIWWICWPGGRIHRLFLAIAVNLVATALLKDLLKGGFGRTWPKTWIENNPSLISDGVYGFNPFHFGAAYQSFPSGHAAAVFAIVSILWLSRTPARWAFAVAGAGVCLALIVMNFHFVSDVIAGAMLGSTTGFYATRIFRLLPVEVQRAKEA